MIIMASEKLITHENSPNLSSVLQKKFFFLKLNLQSLTTQLTYKNYHKILNLFDLILVLLSIKAHHDIIQNESNYHLLPLLLMISVSQDIS